MSLNKKVRNMIRDNGKEETRRKIQSYLSHLKKAIEKAPSIDKGIDISNDILDLEKMLEILNKQ